MDQPTWECAKEIFGEAVEKPGSQRSVFLDSACGGDAELRTQVEALLKAHDEAGGFLSSPTLTPNDTGLSEEPAAGEESPGTRIGPYKLLQRIGEGGFGTVFMAEQVEPIHRKVALKIIKLGMDTKQVIARFEAERQALAMMDHPHIARVFDAGATATGRPYFVMELVKGVPITEYCDANNLSTRERLDLFAPVRQAVQHAHQKGIIHRDIKPSNVMVTLHDGAAVPKVIDFGIAKATHARLTEKTLFTEHRQLIGTPAYMSPEQAEMSGLDVDTRTDIYSLGVLLYELLTGTTPFDPRSLREAAYGELQRIIREVEPPKPSTRLSTLGDQVADVARHRKEEPKTLSRLVRGDLDWIVMKALAKDRAQRYVTSSEFADDIARHLMHEPVIAGPPNVAYRFRKFARRNKGALAAAGAIATSLVVGLGLATMGFIQANEQRRRAESNFQLAREAVDQMLTRVAEQLADLPHVQEVRRELLEDALAYYQGFLEERSDDPDVRSETGRAYRRIGQINEMLGQDASFAVVRDGLVERHVGPDQHRYFMTITAQPRHNRAQEAYDEAIAIHERLAAEFPVDPDHKNELAESYAALGRLLWSSGRPREAQEPLEQAVTIGEELADEFSEVPEYLAALARNLNALGLVEENAQHAEQAFRQALTIFEQHSADAEYGSGPLRYMAAIHNNLAYVLREQRREEEEDTAFQAAVRLADELVADFPDNPDHTALLALQLENQGIHFRRQDRMQEAEQVLSRALILREQLVADFPTFSGYRHTLTRSHLQIGNLHGAEKRFEDAREAYERAIEFQEALVADFPTGLPFRALLGVAYWRLGGTLNATGDLAAAESVFRKTGELYTELIGQSPDKASYVEGLVHSQIPLLRVLRRSEQLEAWATDLRRAMDRFEAILSESAEDDNTRAAVAYTFRLLGKEADDAGDLETAEAIYRRAVDVYARLVADAPDNARYLDGLFISRGLLGRVVRATGRTLEALPIVRDSLREAVDKLEQVVSSSPTINVRESLGSNTWLLGWELVKFGEFEQAQRAYARSFEHYVGLVVEFPTKKTYHDGVARITNRLRRDFSKGALSISAVHNFLATLDHGAYLLAQDEAQDTAAARHALALNYQRLGLELQKAGDLIGAEHALRRSVAQYTQLDAETPLGKRMTLYGYTLLGKVLREQGRIDEAEAAHAEALALRGGRLYADIDHEAYLLAQDQAPNTAAARAALAVNYQRLGPELQKAGDLIGAEHALVGLSLYTQLDAETPLGKRMTLAGYALPKGRMTLYGYALLGKVLREQGQIDEAEAAHAEALALRGGRLYAELYTLIIRSPEGVVEAVERARSIDLVSAQAEPEGLLACGSLLSLAEETEPALAYIEQAIADGAKMHYPDVELGMVLLSLGRQEEARATFTEALASYYAEGYIKRGTSRDVDAVIERWSAGPPRRACPGHWAAAFFLDLVDAEQYSHQSNSWYYIGRRMEIEGRFDDALAAYRSAVNPETDMNVERHLAGYRLQVLTKLGATEE